MKNLKNFQQDYLINKNGQALVELAVLGSILIYCLAMLIQYGMAANYKQNIDMQAFRKAMRIAYYKHGEVASASVSMTHDKPIPDPADPWAFPSRTPISGSGSVTWDSHIDPTYIKNYGDPADDADLPRTILEINDRLDVEEADIRDIRIDTINSSDGAFTTGDYYTCGCVGSKMIVLDRDEAEREALMEQYEEYIVPCNQIHVYIDDAGKKYPAVRINGLRRRVSSIDLDDDGKTETVIAVASTQACDDKNYCGLVTNFAFIDYQEGEIDSDYAVVYPWEQEKSGASLDAQQGVLGDYEITKVNRNRMVKTEDNNTITTTTTYEQGGVGAQLTKHQYRLNDGQPARTVNTIFKPKSFTWTVNK